MARDAKWLAHLDMQAFQETTIGDFLIEEFEEEFGGDQEGLSFDIEALVGELHSITAYGVDVGADSALESGLVARTGDKAKAMIDVYIASQELEREVKTGFKKLEGKDYLTYLAGNEVYLSFPSDGLLIASKSFDRIERALAVIEGEVEDLSGIDSELLLSDASEFFFLATASGIDSVDGVPAQARLLQKAKGGLIELGERESQLVSNIHLVTDGPDVSNQLARIVQGMVALASFTEVGGERLDRLMESVSVEDSDDRVSISLSYPAHEIVRLLGAIVGDGPDRNAASNSKAESGED
ncbi:MAG: hypothetical protein CBD18_06205 [Opitutales bacterium TMED158]|nr:MAG: hypothetical protein CBD18_06205 [Opitutales bacterium TMED158]